MSVIVIKYGGSLLEEPGHRRAFLKDVAALFEKQKLILVHGGGKEISRQMEKAGLKPNFVNGRRFTDDATMTVVKKALTGLNAEIVKELKRLGVQAFGRSGQDEHLLLADAVAELGRVGMPRKVNAEVLAMSLRSEELPVYYSIGEDIDHQPLNINADDFALALAVACRADRLVYLTDTGGVLDAKGQLIPRITSKEVDALGKKQVISGGMLVKAKACVEALQKGVGSVDIVKGIHYLLEPGKVQPEGTVFANGH
jgi:acetylglutamate kinase